MPPSLYIQQNYIYSPIISIMPLHNNTYPLSAKALASLLLFLSFSFQFVSSSFCQDDMATLGGLHDSQTSQNGVEIDELARFAVEEHNKKENAMVEFGRVLKAQEQVVAGILHHLTIEAIEAGKKKIYEAKVWVKPWLNHKELQEFKHAEDVPQFTSSDLGVKQDGHGPGWRDVPKHDPAVQDAADHALKTIQQRSNSLFPYELQEVVDAKAEVTDEVAKFDMVLKVKRGSNEEKFKVEVHKSHQGTYHLNQMAPHA